MKERGFWMRLLPAVCLLLPLLAGCDERKPAAAPAAKPAVGVRPAVMKGVQRSFEFVGRIKAIDKVDVRARVVDPSALGLARCDRGSLHGGDAADNAAAVRRVLDGEKGPHRDITVLNAAAGLVVAGLADDLEIGVDRAAAVIDDGRAAAVLSRLAATSTAAAGR